MLQVPSKEGTWAFGIAADACINFRDDRSLPIVHINIFILNRISFDNDGDKVAYIRVVAHP